MNRNECSEVLFLTFVSWLHLLEFFVCEIVISLDGPTQPEWFKPKLIFHHPPTAFLNWIGFYKTSPYKSKSND